MKLSRRELLKVASAVSAGAVVSVGTADALRVAAAEAAHRGQDSRSQEPRALPPAFGQVQPLGDRVKPIRVDEYQGRIAKAQQAMSARGTGAEALYVTPGTSLAYFTGIRWGLSERIVALLVPRKGDPLLVCPAFEEGRLREQLQWPIEIRVWQEDESPYALAAAWLGERGIRTGRIGVEETTRFVFYDGLRAAAPHCECVSGDPITHACRARKSEHELELMRIACMATFDVYRATFASLKEGMTQADVSSMVSRGFRKIGLGGYGLVLFGPSAALPHGTREEQTLREGEGVLLDGGCSVEGYESDVTRMAVLGKPTEKLRHAFEVVRHAQDAALAAAVAGHESGSVDDAARKVITDAGFGPGYKYFTHRLGHGIGMDGHEWPYLVKGSRTTLEPGMTFSNEPGIYVVGDYGLRCEDDMVITESGAAQLLTAGFQPSLETPIS